MVPGAGSSCGFASMGFEPSGLTGIVEVLVVEELLCVHADGSTHVQTQLLLKKLPLASKTFLRIHLTCEDMTEGNIDFVYANNRVSLWS